jgi:flagellar biosynthesis protein
MTQSPQSDRPSAVALSYAAKNKAPIVVAKGYGAVAESIVQRARESGLYVHASPDLVKLLMHVDLDEQIPPQLYLAIAELLAWLYRLEADSATT